ncbi:Spatacsin C-terminal domain-containing protein [Forsythia ovata]|uniref:Spatacsin C-terminal domain-containing protein n=1 Tax=Forsythia ovata TaxID=205694 RepID=A0ABD1VNM8_9LAMI
MEFFFARLQMRPNSLNNPRCKRQLSTCRHKKDVTNVSFSCRATLLVIWRSTRLCQCAQTSLSYFSPSPDLFLICRPLPTSTLQSYYRMRSIRGQMAGGFTTIVAAELIAKNVGAAVEATNSLPANARTVTFHYNRKSAKRRRLMEPISVDSLALTESKMSTSSGGAKILGVIAKEEREKQAGEDVEASADTDDMAGFLSRMVAALCEQCLFLPLL